MTVEEEDKLIFDRWPAWVRWVLLLPLSLLAFLIGPKVAELAAATMGYDNKYLFAFFDYAMGWTLFIMAALQIAPKHKAIVGTVSLLLVFAAVGILSSSYIVNYITGKQQYQGYDYNHHIPLWMSLSYIGVGFVIDVAIVMGQWQTDKAEKATKIIEATDEAAIV